MTQPAILIIQTGTPPQEIREQYGDLADWFSAAIGYPRSEIEVVRVFEGEILPPPNPQRVAIITGSWAMVTDKLPWSEATALWLRKAMEINMPLFGVCYGHQLMSYALGGEVDYLPCIRETGCLPVRLTAEAENEPLLAGYPQVFPAHLTHMQSVVKVPEGAMVLASSEIDPHQVVRYGPNAISTQYHPEFTPWAAKGMIERNREVFSGEGRDTDAMLAQVTDTPEATALLKRFIEQYLPRP